MNHDPFVRHVSKYTRYLDLVGGYQDVMATYVSIVEGCDKAQVTTYVQDNFKPIEPELRVLRRESGGDRKKAKQTLTSLLNEAHHTGRLLGPNLVMYENPKRVVSFVSQFAATGMTERDKLKIKMHVAKAKGNASEAVFYSNSQGTRKTLNNTISGACASPHNPIYNPSAHTTLTSVCRCATSYSNATCEKMLMGNRHYYSEEVALADMAALIHITDGAKVKTAMEKYSLEYPTVEFTLAHIAFSTDQYWRSIKGHSEQITEFINAMTPLQRAIVCFVGDLKALRDVNPGVVRELITALSKKPTTGVDNPDFYVERMTDETLNLVGIVMQEAINGRRVTDFKKESPEEFKLYGSYIKGLWDTLHIYRTFIDAFFTTDNLPSGIHSFLTSMRHTAVVSDTDSTIYTVEDWVVWQNGKNGFDINSQVTASVMAFLFSSHLVHNLALLSKQLGVEDKRLFQLTMKGEFYQPVLGVTNMTKHYFSYIAACEGDVYKKLKLDIKGVNLKNSRHPAYITKMLEFFIQYIMDGIMSGKVLDIHDVMRIPTMVSSEVRKSLESGSIEYLTTQEIKPPSSYKNPDHYVYKHHLFWDKVYSKRFGKAEDPPYMAVKVPVKLAKKSEVANFVDGLSEELAADFNAGMEEVQRKCCTSMLLPHGALGKNGVPPELIDVQDTIRLEGQLMTGFYSILETLGLVIRNDKDTRPLSNELDLSVYGDGALDEWVSNNPCR